MSGDLEIKEKSFEFYQALNRLKMFVERNGLNGLTLRRAAEVAGMEMTHFSTFFHVKVGVTFSDWRRHERITQSVNMLITKDTPITTVAYEVGFEDLRSFERSFKRLVGVTPREFRRRNQPG